MVKINTRLLAALFMTLAFVGCKKSGSSAKSKKVFSNNTAVSAPENVTLNNIPEKLNGNPNTTYLMSITTEGSSINAPVIPFEVSDAELVKLEFTESHLRVMRAASHFEGNEQNKTLLVSIPIVWKDEPCDDKSDSNACKSKEEAPWTEKTEYVPTYSNVEINGAVGLSVYRDQYISNCYTPAPSKLITYQNEPGVLNIVTETNWRTNPQCVDMEQFNNWSDVSFTTRQTISVIDEKLAASENYAPMQNTPAGLNSQGQPVEFGLFWGLTLKDYDVTNKFCQGEGCSVDFVQRWNPARKEIVYYLADEFALEENQILKSATLESFNRLNAALEKANAEFRIRTEQVYAGENGKKYILDLSTPGKPKQVEFIPGDLRYSMIALVNDPVTMGLLGYGPSITHPLTGEIISARNVMFKGVMKKTIERSYNEWVKDKILKTKETSIVSDENSESAIEGQQTKEAHAQSKEFILSKLSSPAGLSYYLKFKKLDPLFSKSFLTKSSDLNNYSLTKKLKKFELLLDPNSQSDTYSFFSDKYSAGNWNQFINVAGMTSVAKSLPLDVSAVRKIHAAISPAQLEYLTQSDIANPEKTSEWLSRNNYFTTEFVNKDSFGHEAMDELITEFQGDDSTPKTWNRLTKSQRAKAVDTLLPILWIPTFVHEVGHNLGLRHNFHGSHDKENFAVEYNESGQVVSTTPYSSIMDYAYGTTNELSHMGEYDVAALKWAYGKTVTTGGVVQFASESYDASALGVSETTPVVEYGAVLVSQPTGETFHLSNSQVRKLNSEGLVALKNYEYCTDDHVALDPTCNRFDEGTNIIEIMDHYIRAYHDGYEERYFRNERENFNNVWGDLAHISYLSRTFDTIESIFVRHTMDLKQIQSPQDFLRPENMAAAQRLVALHMASEFLLDILKTPDVLCALATADNPEQIVSLFPMASAPFFSTCKDIEPYLNPDVRVIGQTGRSFRDIRDYRNPSSWIAQIDVRGVWLDKLMALRMLLSTSSKLNFDDRSDMNFLDIADYSIFGFPNIAVNTEELFTDILKDSLVGPVTFNTNYDYVTNDDEFRKLIASDLSIETSYSFAMDLSHRIRPSGHPGVSQYFGVSPQKGNHFNDLIVQYVKQNATSDFNPFSRRSLESKFSATKINVFDSYNKNLAVFDVPVGEYRYLTSPENSIANSTFTYLFEGPQIVEKMQAFLSDDATSLNSEGPASDRGSSEGPSVSSEASSIQTISSSSSSSSDDTTNSSADERSKQEILMKVLEQIAKYEIPSDETLFYADGSLTPLGDFVFALIPQEFIGLNSEKAKVDARIDALLVGAQTGFKPAAHYTTVIESLTK